MGYDFERVWGSDGAALVAEPDIGKAELGWDQGASAAPPDARWQNWNMKRTTEQMQYIQNHGVMQWAAGANYKQGTACFYENVFYYAKRDNVAVTPDTGVDDWHNMGASFYEFFQFARGFVVVTAAANIFPNILYALDSRLSVFTLTIPATLTVGDDFLFSDYGFNLSTNNVTIARNGHKVVNLEEDFIQDTNYKPLDLTYSGTDRGLIIR